MASVKVGYLHKLRFASRRTAMHQFFGLHHSCQIPYRSISLEYVLCSTYILRYYKPYTIGVLSTVLFLLPRFKIFIMFLPECAENLSRFLFEHLEAWHVLFSSNWGHCLPPLDSGRISSRVRIEVPIPHATLHLDHELHSPTWQSITERKRKEVKLV